MAKRRNLKKEKAQRNRAYARKFRKPTNGRNGRFNRRRDNGSNNQQNGAASEGNQKPDDSASMR